MSINQLSDSGGAEDVGQEDIVAGVQKCSLNLMYRVHDFIDYMKLSQGDQLVQIESCHLLNLIEDTLLYIKEISLDYGKRLSCFVDPSIPERIQVDSKKLQKSLSRLLLNSLKRTISDSVKLYVHLTVDAKVKFEIIDSGPLITEQDQKVLFNTKEYHPSEVSQGCMDFAFGYLMALHLLNSLNIQLGYLQKNQTISYFWFEFELVSEIKIESSAKNSLIDVKILMVDDLPSSSRELNQQLTAWGAEVMFFDNESGAVRFFSQFNPATDVNLIVLHLHDGLESHAALLRSIGHWMQQQQ